MNKNKNLKQLIEEERQLEAKFLTAKTEEARNYLQKLESEISQYNNLVFIENKVAEAIKECYRARNTSGYPIFQSGDYYYDDLFSTSFVFPAEKKFGGVFSEILNLRNTKLSFLERINNWLTVKLLNEASYIDSAESINLSCLKSIFKKVESLDCLPYLNLTLYETEYSNIDNEGNIVVRFGYQKK